MRALKTVFLWPCFIHIQNMTGHNKFYKNWVAGWETCLLNSCCPTLNLSSTKYILGQKSVTSQKQFICWLLNCPLRNQGILVAPFFDVSGNQVYGVCFALQGDTVYFTIGIHIVVTPRFVRHLCPVKNNEIRHHKDLYNQRTFLLIQINFIVK